MTYPANVGFGVLVLPGFIPVFHGLTKGVNAFCSTSLLYGIAPIPAGSC
jgi:hypothetical protein